MKERVSPAINAHLLRGGCYVVLLLTGTLLVFLRPEAPAKVSHRTLTFAERIAYQRAIEEVYWRHRIWPKQNPDPKPSLDAIMSQTQLENKVAGYMRDSQMLEDHWQKPITAEQLQPEMDRMARDTKQPEVLRELFQALENDPSVIAECLARPVLAERLVADLSAHDKDQRLASLRTKAASSKFSITTSGKATYTLPEIDPCTDDTWTPTSVINAPDGRQFHTAIWTGSEMIVWGGNGPGGPLFNTGGRYNPTTDSWTATSTINAPAGRWIHTAVWNGSEMIVWGGGGPNDTSFNTGGRYNPGTDSWAATSINNVPAARGDHTAVWTGSEMIVWGGTFFDGQNNHYLNTGGRYNPATDTWTATSTTNAPSGRFRLTAVWTGSEMIVWGGWDDTNPFNTGGRYNPSTDTWTATSTTNVPGGRFAHTAVWTGSEMIVWGGSDHYFYLNTGGRYNPGTDSWTATSTTNVPDGRFYHTAVWTGSEMIVWGGTFFVICNPQSLWVNTGGRYNPGTDTWIATSTTNAPHGRAFHTVVWTGSEMIVWGGYTEGLYIYFNNGGRYCAQSNPPPTPTATPTTTPTPCHVISPEPACDGLVTGTPPTDFTVNLSDPADPATVHANAFTVNCTAADGLTLTNGNSTIVFNFNTTPVTQGVNIMHIPAGAFDCGNGPVAEFTCTFTYEASTPTPTPTPATPTPTATVTPTATATPRVTPTPRSRPTPAPRP